jgi:hypothetical protein
MKKVLLTSALSIVFMSTIFAQVKFGVTAGLNVSTLSANKEVSFKHKAGFQAGAVVDWAVADKVSIVPELLFTQRGAKYKNISKSSVKLNYLQIPVNVAYKFDVGLGSQIFVFAGPYLGCALSGSKKYEGKSQSIKFGSDKNKFKPVDFGINVGAGYYYSGVFFKLQYNLGLNKLNNDRGSIKSRNIAVSTGYFF